MDKFVTRSSSTPNLATKRPRDDTGVQWHFPKRFAAPKRISKEGETSTSNRFESLAVDGNDDILQLFSKATKKKPSGKVPPIVIEFRDDWNHQKIKDTIDSYDKTYHLQYRGNHRVKVQCYSSTGHQAVKEGLSKENVSYHTFTRRDEKSPKAVIKGLPKLLQDTLPSDLAAIGFPDAKQDHPANFSRCSERLKYLDRIKSRRDTLRSARTAFPTKAIPVATMNFSQAVSSATQPQLLERQMERKPSESVKTTHLLHGPTAILGEKNAEHQLQDAEHQLQDADTKEMLQILSAIKALKHEFRKCVSYMDKVILIMSHVGHYF
ncbi:Gag-like protein [Operophtera brumata]|uniref:Gag-like protein n=1 Tax=Operophtera brumata TaxID=104452 RepID=A0A0L7KP36_OPEBR|nr:Gag-like protein [Operophtera brumata]KOB74087.1 Gag-like protein [Operophtera brumata]